MVSKHKMEYTKNGKDVYCLVIIFMKKEIAIVPVAQNNHESHFCQKVQKWSYLSQKVTNFKSETTAGKVLESSS